MESTYERYFLLYAGNADTLWDIKDYFFALAITFNLRPRRLHLVAWIGPSGHIDSGVLYIQFAGRPSDAIECRDALYRAMPGEQEHVIFEEARPRDEGAARLLDAVFGQSEKPRAYRFYRKRRTKRHRFHDY